MAFERDAESTTSGILSNRSSFGCTEYDCIKRVHDGVAELVAEQSKKPSSPGSGEVEGKPEDPVEEKVDAEATGTDDNNKEVENDENDNILAADADDAPAPPADVDPEKIDDTSFVIERTEEDEAGKENAENIAASEEVPESAEAPPEAPEAPEETPPNSPKTPTDAVEQLEQLAQADE